MARLLSACIAIGVFSLATIAGQAPVDAGRKVFSERCALCHGADGTGGTFATSIVPRLAALDEAALESTIRNGVPARGMPAFALPPPEMTAVIAYLRTLRPATRGRRDRLEPLHAQTTGGDAIDGLVLRQSFDDLQLRAADGSIRLFRRAGDRFRPVTSETDWASYDGAQRGYRYTALTEISPSNVGQLAPRWLFTVADTSPLETTPIVSNGVMFVTSGNQCYALDAGSGRQIWRFSRPLTKGLVGNAAGGINRGAAVDGTHVYMTTDHAHLLALDRASGEVAWEAAMADARENYSATGAPLVAGGDGGARGFLAAYDPQTGKEAWRFWTVPSPGEPKADTWRGKGIDHPGATTWLTGTYDPELDLVYWPTGNPSPDLIGDDRPGDNLYSDSVVALEAKTGRLRWHFQFTPHDVWDYDAQETPALVDATWRGAPRKLLVQVNRNGFMYVLDRTTGQFLFGKQYAKNVTWASGLTAEGRPIVVPGMEPTHEGKRVCPSLEGASNWYSTSFNPQTGLYYVQTNDKCGIFTRTDMEWAAGKGFMGGSFKQAPDEPAQRVLRAIDIQTGKIAWELPQTGAVDSWGGVLSTAGGVVIFGEDSGSLMAADAKDGKPLWSFPTNQLWKASPMTYMFDNTQYVAVASGPNIISFALPK